MEPVILSEVWRKNCAKRSPRTCISLLYSTQKKSGWAVLPIPLKKRLGKPLRKNLMSHPVQRQVQLEHIHARLTQETELPPCGVVRDQFANRVFS